MQDQKADAFLPGEIVCFEQIEYLEPTFKYQNYQVPAASSEKAKMKDSYENKFNVRVVVKE